MLVVNGALDRFLIPPNAFPAPLALTFALNSIFSSSCRGVVVADQVGGHNRRGNAKILAREVERLYEVGCTELLDRKSKPIQVHLRTFGLVLRVPPSARR